MDIEQQLVVACSLVDPSFDEGHGHMHSPVVIFRPSSALVPSSDARSP